MLFSPSTAALNHLLIQNSWALPRLAHHAGKSVRFDVTPLSLAYTILENGLLHSASPTDSSDALCTIAPSLLARLALHDESAYSEIHSEGDAALLAEIFFLSRNLRWDAAEDLSKIVGDIAAERIVQTAQRAQHQLHSNALNFSRAAMEYLTEERPLLAKSQHISTFVQQVDTLRDDVARLEQRISRLHASENA